MLPRKVFPDAAKNARWVRKRELVEAKGAPSECTLEASQSARRAATEVLVESGLLQSEVPWSAAYSVGMAI